MVVVGILSASLLAPLTSSAPGYDPLRIAEATGVRVVDLTLRDEARKRDIPLRVYMEEGESARPVVLFSHGLGGSREGNAYLGRHWAARGYIVVFLQHPGSDESVWRGVRPLERMAAMRRAADATNFGLRVRDVSAVLDALEDWNAKDGHALRGRLDLHRVGMSGHSFGAVTTQAVSGQSFVGRSRFTDPRIRAALAMSPSSPKGADPADAFGQVRVPWMLMTGTHDVAAIGDQDAASRLKVFPALPKGSKYELVLDRAVHSAFGDRALPGERQARNPNHHRAILALSTAFWDAYLRDDKEARAWLDGIGPSTVLEKSDGWQRK